MLSNIFKLLSVLTKEQLSNPLSKSMFQIKPRWIYTWFVLCTNLTAFSINFGLTVKLSECKWGSLCYLTVIKVKKIRVGMRCWDFYPALQGEVSFMLFGLLWTFTLPKTTIIFILFSPILFRKAYNLKIKSYHKCDKTLASPRNLESVLDYVLSSPRLPGA